MNVRCFGAVGYDFGSRGQGARGWHDLDALARHR